MQTTKLWSTGEQSDTIETSDLTVQAHSNWSNIFWSIFFFYNRFLLVKK